MMKTPGIRFILQPVALAIAALLAAGCASGPPPDPVESQVRLTLLATVDFHGALLSEARDDGGRILGGAAALAATIERERRANPDGTLVLDGGDSFHGTALSNLSEGRPTLDFMNLAGFDAAAVGNHGFDFGVPVLRERMAQAEFSWLIANIRRRFTGRPPSWARPSAILERRRLRIAVIGLIATNTPVTTLPSNVADYEFPAPGPIANRWVEELVPAEADVAVLLTHVGLRPAGDGGVDGELVEMAEQVPGAAAIVGGHTHQLHAGEIHGISVVQPGERGRHLGRIDLVWDRGLRRVMESATRILPVFADAVTPDAAVAELVERYRREMDERMQQSIGRASRDIERHLDRECGMGNLFTDAIRAQIGADVVLQNSRGGARIDRRRADHPRGRLPGHAVRQYHRPDADDRRRDP